MEDAGEGRGPGPAGGEVECVAAGGVGHAAGCGDESAAGGGSGDEFGSAGADGHGPAGEVVGEGGEAEPGAVGVEPAGWAVCEAVVFQVADGEFDDGMGAVVEVFIAELAGAVRDEGVVVPGWEEWLGVFVEDVNASNDESTGWIVVVVVAFGDLAVSGVGVVGHG